MDALELAQKVVLIKQEASDKAEHVTESDWAIIYDCALDKAVEACQVFAFTSYLTQHGYKWHEASEPRIASDGSRYTAHLISIDVPNGVNGEDNLVVFDQFIIGFNGAQAIINHLTKGKEL